MTRKQWLAWIKKVCREAQKWPSPY